MPLLALALGKTRLASRCSYRTSQTNSFVSSIVSHVQEDFFRPVLSLPVVFAYGHITPVSALGVFQSLFKAFCTLQIFGMEQEIWCVLDRNRQYFNFRFVPPIFNFLSRFAIHSSTISFVISSITVHQVIEVIIYPSSFLKITIGLMPYLGRNMFFRHQAWERKCFLQVNQSF